MQKYGVEIWCKVENHIIKISTCHCYRVHSMLSLLTLCFIQYEVTIGIDNWATYILYISCNFHIYCQTIVVVTLHDDD